jgi:GNAT superfamily N-acetyltransferase
MKIRHLTACDLYDLGRLYEQFWGEACSPEKMRSTFNKLRESPNHIFLVAEQANRLAGAATGIVCEALYGDCRPFMVVEDVVVHRDSRRQGVATALMRTLEERASECRCSTILFVTESERTGAHRFYESLGYSSDRYKGFKKRLERIWDRH